MIVVLVLSNKSDGGLSVVRIKSRHVQIINEIDELVLSNRSIASTCLSFELLLKLVLQESRVSVVVEVDNLLKELLFCWVAKVIEETLCDLSLTTSSVSNQHW